MLTFVFMIAFAVLIWVGKGKNPIDSSLMARVRSYFPDFLYCIVER